MKKLNGPLSSSTQAIATTCVSAKVAAFLPKAVAKVHETT
jgi:hypothetical protein